MLAPVSAKYPVPYAEDTNSKWAKVNLGLPRLPMFTKVYLGFPRFT